MPESKLQASGLAFSQALDIYTVGQAQRWVGVSNSCYYQTPETLLVSGELTLSPAHLTTMCTTSSEVKMSRVSSDCFPTLYPKGN